MFHVTPNKLCWARTMSSAFVDFVLMDVLKVLQFVWFYAIYSLACFMFGVRVISSFLVFKNRLSFYSIHILVPLIILSLAFFLQKVHVLHPSIMMVWSLLWHSTAIEKRIWNISALAITVRHVAIDIRFYIAPAGAEIVYFYVLRVCYIYCILPL